MTSRKSKQFYGDNVYNVGDDTDMPDRDPFDFYPTPWSVIEYAVQFVLRQAEPIGNQWVADVGAGSGRWGEVWKHYWRQTTLDGYEIQKLNYKLPFYDFFYPGDVLKEMNVLELYNFIIGNPPFLLFHKAHVREFFQMLHGALQDYGWLTLLARGAIDESAIRYKEIFSWWKPMYEIVLVDRVSWYPEGHPRCGDSKPVKHSLYFWRKGSNPEYTMKLWAAGLPNDNKYNGIFKGHNTWNTMKQYGLVKEKKANA